MRLAGVWYLVNFFKQKTVNFFNPTLSNFCMKPCINEFWSNYMIFMRKKKIWHEPIVLACSSFNNSVPMRIQFHSVHWSQKKCSQSSILASSAQLKPNWWTELVLNSIPPATGQPTRASGIVLSSFNWALLRKQKSKNGMVKMKR